MRAQGYEPGAELAQRVRAGGWIEEEIKNQRGDDGSLHRWYFADTGAASHFGRFVPLVDLGPGSRVFDNLGALGLLSLVCHGPGDLLGMTDAGFHFQALGVGDDVASLRQFVVLPWDGDGARGHAALLDRQLAVTKLLREGDHGVRAELQVLVEKRRLPAPLLEYVWRQLAPPGAGAATARRRLDPKTLLLPAALDACLVVEHARLPDLSFLVPVGRRIGALVTARLIERAGGRVSDAARNGAQFLADQVAEAPFEFVRQYGNLRFDHSCVVVHARDDARQPVDVTWQAAGQLEADRWQRADLASKLAKKLAHVVVTFAPDRLLLSTLDLDQPGTARPAEAADLLADTGAALRVVVPGKSHLLRMLAFLRLPAAKGIELRASFGDPATVDVVVDAPARDDAEAWVVTGKALLAQLQEPLEHAPPTLAGCEGWTELARALPAAEITTHDARVTARFTFRGFTRTKVAAIALALAQGE